MRCQLGGYLVTGLHTYIITTCQVLLGLVQLGELSIFAMVNDLNDGCWWVDDGDLIEIFFGNRPDNEGKPTENGPHISGSRWILVSSGVATEVISLIRDFTKLQVAIAVEM